MSTRMWVQNPRTHTCKSGWFCTLHWARLWIEADGSLKFTKVKAMSRFCEPVAKIKMASNRRKTPDIDLGSPWVPPTSHTQHTCIFPLSSTYITHNKHNNTHTHSTWKIHWTKFFYCFPFLCWQFIFNKNALVVTENKIL